MKIYRNLYFLIVINIFLLGCAKEPETGPAEVRWDRDTCVRCAMTVSDRHYAVQIRGGPGKEKKSLYKFDDIGCAVVWLNEQSWLDKPANEIWITHFDTGEWLDAREARYLTGKTTPMDYGLGATNENLEGSLSFEQAREHILMVESQTGRHKKHMHTGDMKSMQ